MRYPKSVCLFSCLCSSPLQCVCAPECVCACVSQHAVWPWWPCFGWLMCWREQQGAQVGPEPQSDTLLLPCCFTYVDAARLLLPSHLTLPPLQHSQHSQVPCIGLHFEASGYSVKVKLLLCSFSSNFLFHILPILVAHTVNGFGLLRFKNVNSTAINDLTFNEVAQSLAFKSSLLWNQILS